MVVKLKFVGFPLVALLVSVQGTSSQPREITIEDHFRLRDLSDPRLSPDGAWVAYTVTTRHLDDDETRSHIWMVPVGTSESGEEQGARAVRMTSEEFSSTHPRFSPDGKYLAFLSARGEEKAQVWLLFRHGGEAVRLTDSKQGVTSFAWSPDGSAIVLVVKDPEPAEGGDPKDEKRGEETPSPWVIDRLQFKRDYEGYLDRRRTHLYVLDVADRGEPRQITHGDYDDTSPAWSPDGTKVAFASNRTPEPDSNYDSDIWVVNVSGGEPARVSEGAGEDGAPVWSPDGTQIAFVSAADVDALVYATYHLAIAPADGGETRLLTDALDRHVSNPRFSRDGAHLYFTMQDRGEQPLARLPLTRPGPVERLIGGERVVEAYDLGPDGSVAALVSTPSAPAEVYVRRGGELHKRSRTNDELLSNIRVGLVEKLRFASRDGTPIEAFVVKPPDFREGRRYPTILRLHGGPVDQYDFRFHFEAQLFAARGYLVVLPNPRGSSGYGQDFSLGIWRGWGEKDYEDVMAAVDFSIERGDTDPERLGVMGWSYGGMLTNHVITKTTRFAAAITGASATLYVSNYGHDQYQRWWEGELGLPWEPEARRRWEALSPFNNVEEILTPTLIVGGEKDWNVPILNSEQLYIALKRLGRQTQLVVYPGEHHSIQTPSYRKDLYERYVDWFDKYLQGPESSEE